MGAGQPNGFDAVYEIGRDALLLQALPRLLPFLKPGLAFPISLLPRTGEVAVQQLSFASVERGGARDIVLKVNCGLTLSGLGVASVAAQDYTVKLNDLLNTLRKISTSFGVPLAELQSANPDITDPDLALLPGTVVHVTGAVPSIAPINSVPSGTTTVGMALTISAGAKSGSQIPLSVRLNNAIAVNVDGGGNGIAVKPLGIGAQDPLVSALSQVKLQGLAETIRTLIQDALRARVSAFFPVNVPIVVPAPVAESCFIAPTAIDVRVLPPANAAQNTMSLVLLLKQGAAGNSTVGVTSTTLPAPNVALSLGPSLLSKLICCAMSKTALVNRQGPTSSGTNSCRWDNLGERRFENETVNFQRLELTVATGQLNVLAVFTKSAVGFTVRATVTVAVGLQLESDSSVASVPGTPVVDLDYEIEWWVWLLAAVLAIVFAIFAFVATVPILITIGQIGLIVEGILLLVFLAIVGIVGASLSQALDTLPTLLKAPQVLPPALIELFGSVLPQTLVFDDLKLAGRPVFPPRNAAVFVRQLAPRELTTGQSFTASVTMWNSGTRTWTASAPTPYRLGSQNPQDNTRWGRNRVDVPVPTPMGSSVTFQVPITAPAQAGAHNFQWKMVQERVQWFGASTPNVVVNVVGKAEKDTKDDKDVKEAKEDKDDEKLRAKEKEFDEFDQAFMRQQSHQDEPGAAGRELAGEEQGRGATEATERGRAFITPAERPPVGEAVVEDPSETL